jgi:hypothetical protein
MMEEGIYEGPGLNSCTGMDHHADWLINDNKMFVFKQNRNWNILRSNFDRLRLRFRHGNSVTGAHGLTRPTDDPVDENMTRFDKRLDS